MLIDFRPHARLRGKSPIEFADCVVPVVQALGDGPVDLDRARIVCDWVQYRANFRDAVDIRPILPRADATGAEPAVPGTPAGEFEVAVDARRSASVDLRALTGARLREQAGERVFLEEWGPGSASCIWAFNARYWSSLDAWEKVTGHGYEQALPGGASDARNREAALDLIGELFALWDSLAARSSLPDELYVVEFGVGNGGQARVFLDEFRALDQVHGHGYYRRLHYLMCDYSQHVLDLARETVAGHAEHVNSVALDAMRPCTSLGFLRGKVFLAYISNVYDNLPTDEVAQLGGRTYCVQTRAYLSAEAAATLAAQANTTSEELPGLVHKLLRLGPALLAEALPAHFADVDAAAAFWQATWAEVRLADRYVPLAGLDSYQLVPGASGELLRPLLESGPDIRMQVSNGALQSFVDTIKLLHPFGRLVCHDLFVTDVHGYRTAFRGPGKYDGSVVNWVNGPLLGHVGRRNGFDVHYEPFRHRTGGNIVTMTAQVGD
jgi:hypothetical protein